MNENSTPQPLPINADTLNALMDAMGALTMCLARQMTPAQKAGLAADMARLAAQAHATGNVEAGRLMSDLSRAAAR